MRGARLTNDIPRPRRSPSTQSARLYWWRGSDIPYLNPTQKSRHLINRLRTPRRPIRRKPQQPIPPLLNRPAPILRRAPLRDASNRLLSTRVLPARQFHHSLRLCTGDTLSFIQPFEALKIEVLPGQQSAFVDEATVLLTCYGPRSPLRCGDDGAMFGVGYVWAAEGAEGAEEDGVGG